MGEELKNVIPLAKLPIVGDGNCLFRALSAILTGSQDNYSIIREEICRFMVTEGASFVSRYLETKFEKLTTPSDYLKNSQMHSDKIWGTDVEIITLSKMLRIVIFVSNLQSHPRRKECHSTWYRYCSDYRKNSNPALYLANHSDYHYEPVIDLIHCQYSPFYNSYSFSDAIVIE